MDFAGKKISVFGIQGSGKTHLAKKIMGNYRAPIVYAVHKEDFADTRCYIFKARNLQADLEPFCKRVKEMAQQGKIDCMVLDEADMFVRDNFDISPSLLDLVLNHRHYNLAMIFISRRPQDLPTRIVESCHYLFCFMLEGENALKKFQNIHPDFPNLLKSLDYQRHNFVFKELGRPPQIHAPV